MPDYFHVWFSTQTPINRKKQFPIMKVVVIIGANKNTDTGPI